MSSESLSIKAFKGILWNIFGSTTSQIIGLTMGVILARLIAPESYGLIAMASVVIGITSVFVDAGFSTALIQKTEVSQNDFSTVFWFNLLVSFVVYGVIFVIAPWVELYFKTDGLTEVIRWLSISIIINGLIIVQRQQLSKKLKFKVINLLNTLAGLVSGALGISLALLDYGVWALVAQHLSVAFFSGLFIFTYNRWLPSWVFDRQSFLFMWGYGSKLFASGIIIAIFENIYPIIVGRFFSAASLAYYSRAEYYQQMISRNLTIVVRSVSFLSTAQIQDDHQRMKNAYRKMISMVIMFNAPAMLGLSVIAHSLIIVLITDKWLPTVPYLQWLCFSGLLYPLQAINLNIVLVKGRSDIFLRLEIIKKIMIVLSIFIGLPWGVMGLVIGIVIVSFLSYLIDTTYSIYLIGYRFEEQIRDILPYIGLAVFMAIVVSSVNYFIVWPLTWQLLLQLGVGVIIYFGGCHFFRLEAWKVFKEMIFNVSRK